MTTEGVRSEVTNSVIAALGQIEEEIFLCDNQDEWNVIEQQMRDINKEVQSLLLFYIPEHFSQHCKCCVYQFESQTLELPRHVSLSCVDSQSAAEINQLLLQENYSNNVSPKSNSDKTFAKKQPSTETDSKLLRQEYSVELYPKPETKKTSGILPFFKMGSEQIQKLKPKVHKAVAKIPKTSKGGSLQCSLVNQASVSCVEKHTSLETQSLNKDVDAAREMCTTVDPSKICEANSVHVVRRDVENCGSFLQNNTDIHAGQATSQEDATAEMPGQDVISSQMSVVCFAMLKQMVGNNSNTVNDSITANCDSLNESKISSKSTLEADIVSESVTSRELDVIQTESIQHETPESISVKADFSLADESRMLSESTMEGIINTLDADISSKTTVIETYIFNQTNNDEATQNLNQDESTCNMSLAVADFSMIDESRILSESLDVDLLSSKNMSVSEEIFQNNDEFKDNASHVIADLNLVSEKRILSKSPMDGIINTLDASSELDSISETFLSSEIDKHKVEAMEILSKPNKKESTTNDSYVTVDFSFTDQSRMLSESTMEGIMNRLDIDVSSKILTPIKKNHDDDIEMSQQSNQNACNYDGVCNGQAKSDVYASDGHAITPVVGFDSVIVHRYTSPVPFELTLDHHSSSSTAYECTKMNCKKEKEKSVGRLHSMTKKKNKPDKQKVVKPIGDKKKKKYIEERAVGKLCEGTSCKSSRSVHSKAVSDIITDTTTKQHLKQKLNQPAHLSSKEASCSRFDENKGNSKVQPISKRFVDNVNDYSYSKMPSAKQTKKLKHSVDFLLQKICSRRLLQKSEKKQNVETNCSVNKQVNPQPSWFANNPFRGIFKKKSNSLTVSQNSCAHPIFACVGEQNISGVGERRSDSVCHLIAEAELPQRYNSQSLVQDDVTSDSLVNSSTYNRPADHNEYISSDIYSNEVPESPVFHYNLPVDFDLTPKPVNRSAVTNDYLLSNGMIASPSISVSPWTPMCELGMKGIPTNEMPCSYLMTEPAFTTKVPSDPTLSPLISFYFRSGMPVPSTPSVSSHQKKFLSSTVLPMYEPLMEEDTLFETAIDPGSDETWLYPITDYCPVYESGPLPESMFSPHSGLFSPPTFSSICEPLSPLAISPPCDPQPTFSPLPPVLSPICDAPTFNTYPNGTPSPPHLSPVQELNNMNKPTRSTRQTQFLSKRNLDVEVREDNTCSKGKILSIKDIISPQCEVKPANQCHWTSTPTMKTSSKSPPKKMKYSKRQPVQNNCTEKCVTSPKETLLMIAAKTSINRNPEISESSAVASNLSPNIKIPSISLSKKQTYSKPPPLKDYMETFVNNPEKSILVSATNFDMSLLEELTSLKDNEQNEAGICVFPESRLDMKSEVCKTKKQKPYCVDDRLPIKKRYMRSLYQNHGDVLPRGVEKQQTAGVRSRHKRKKNNWPKKKLKSPPTIATMENICKHLNKFMDIPANSVRITCRRSHKPHLLELAKMCYIQVNQTDLCIELKKTSDSRRPTATDMDWLWTIRFA